MEARLTLASVGVLEAAYSKLLFAFVPLTVTRRVLVAPVPAGVVQVSCVKLAVSTTQVLFAMVTELPVTRGLKPFPVIVTTVPPFSDPRAGSTLEITRGMARSAVSHAEDTLFAQSGVGPLSPRSALFTRGS